MDKKTLLLFDVDGTLTGARKKIEPWMDTFMEKVRGMITCGLVGGSDLPKIAEQLGGLDAAMMYTYVFSENGLVAYKNKDLIATQSITKQIGEEKIQKVVDFASQYMSELTLPAKTSNFVEVRTGLINFCPVGRSCSQELRDGFAEYDKKHGIRTAFKKALEDKFSDYGLTFAIGGQISIDCYPNGWDKTFCLRFVEKDFEEIHFFGDKTMPGGNDHAIYVDKRTIGHSVTSPEDTMNQLKIILKID